MHIVIQRRVIFPGVVRLIASAEQRFQLSQRERIALGLLGHSDGLSADELIGRLELSDPSTLRPWISHLIDLGLVEQSGRTRATRYFVPAGLLRDAGLDGRTTLTRIEPHRLRALVVEDVARYPGAAASEIHRRVGPEIWERTFRRAIEELLKSGAILAQGERRWRRYHPIGSIGQNTEDDR